MPPRIWIPRSAALHRVLRRDHLRERRLLEALAPVRLQPRRLQDDELGLVAPHRDVGDVVLEDLELADLLAERLALLARRRARPRARRRGCRSRTPERMIRSLLSVGSSMYHASPGSPSTSVVGHEDVAQADVARADRAHPELRQLGDLHALGVGRARGTASRPGGAWRRSSSVRASSRM